MVISNYLLILFISLFIFNCSNRNLSSLNMKAHISSIESGVHKYAPPQREIISPSLKKIFYVVAFSLVAYLVLFFVNYRPDIQYMVDYSSINTQNKFNIIHNFSESSCFDYSEETIKNLKLVKKPHEYSTF